MASLVADYGESSHESNEDSDCDSNCDKSDTTTNERLPPPTFSDKIKNSVFVNPYQEAENAQFAVLEKHVKMVPQENNTKNSKKICWMFKKGKCRVGKKCKFSHVENNINSTILMVQKDSTKELLDNSCNNSIPSTEQLNIINSDNLIDEENISDEDQPNKKRKKHFGLTQGLIPSKKVIQMYKRQK